MRTVRIDSLEAKHTLYNKLKSIRAFSLTEMMVAMLIMVLASTLMAAGIPVAIDTYQKTVKVANAQVALSTTVEVLKSELGRATDIQYDATNKVIFYCADDGYWAAIRNTVDGESNHGLVKQYYTQNDDGTFTELLSESEQPLIYPLVSDAVFVGSQSAGEEMWLSFSHADLESGNYISIANLYVYENSDNSDSHVYDESDSVFARAGQPIGTEYLYRIWTPFR